MQFYLFIYFDFDCGVTGVCVFFKKKTQTHCCFFRFCLFFSSCFSFLLFLLREERKAWVDEFKILDYLMIEGGFLSIHLFLAFPAPFFTREAYINFSVTLEKKGKVELKSENEQEQ